LKKSIAKRDYGGVSPREQEERTTDGTRRRIPWPSRGTRLARTSIGAFINADGTSESSDNMSEVDIHVLSSNPRDAVEPSYSVKDESEWQRRST
jgi:hypothetical protein